MFTHCDYLIAISMYACMTRMLKDTAAQSYQYATQPT